jgi:hypothetical protein
MKWYGRFKIYEMIREIAMEFYACHHIIVNSAPLNWLSQAKQHYNSNTG